MSQVLRQARAVVWRGGRVNKDEQPIGEGRDTCPHCGGPLRVRVTVERAEEQPNARATVSFAQSQHPAIVAERRRRAVRSKPRTH